MVLPKPLTERFYQKLGFYSCTVPTFEQYVLAELINSGDFERHINRVRRKMRKKVRKLTLKKAHKKMRMELMTSPVMTSLTAMMAVMKNAQKTAQIRQKRNATADRAILTPLPGLATVTPTP